MRGFTTQHVGRPPPPPTPADPFVVWRFRNSDNSRLSAATARTRTASIRARPRAISNDSSAPSDETQSPATVQTRGGVKGAANRVGFDIEEARGRTNTPRQGSVRATGTKARSFDSASPTSRVSDVHEPAFGFRETFSLATSAIRGLLDEQCEGHDLAVGDNASTRKQQIGRMPDGRLLSTPSTARGLSFDAGAAQEDQDELTMLNDSPTEPWFVCFLLVGFDIDKGPVIESCVPDFSLTEREKECICAHAMPDSAASGPGREDALFSFRVVRRAASTANADGGSSSSTPAPGSTPQGSQHISSPTNISESGSSLDKSFMHEPCVSRSGDWTGATSAVSSTSVSEAKEAIQASYKSTDEDAEGDNNARHRLRRNTSSYASSRRLLLAHSLFRQAPDPSSPRGSFQKALVLVTSTPYLNMPRILLTCLADNAFVYGQTALERAVADASQWPDPCCFQDESTFSLRFLNSELAMTLPASFLTSFAAPQAAVREGAAQANLDLAKDLENSVGSTHVGPGVTANAACTYLADHTHAPSVDRDGIPAPDLDRHRDALRKSAQDPILATGSHVSRQRQQPAMHEHPGATVPKTTRGWPLCLPSSNPSSPPFHEIDLIRSLCGAHDKIWALWELIALGEPIAVFASTPSQCASAVLGLVGLIHPLPYTGDWRPYFSIQDPDYVRLLSATSLRDALPRGAIFGITSIHVLDTLRFPHVLTISGPGDKALNFKHRPGLKTSYKPLLHKSRQLSSVIHSSIHARNKHDETAISAAAFEVRACLLERVTRPFLRAFDRYLTPTWGSDRAVTLEPYASDPFGRSLSLPDLRTEAFPTNEDLSGPGVLPLFRAGAVSKSRARVFYARFIKGPVFRSWWRAARRVGERECIAMHRNDMLEAMVRGKVPLANTTGSTNSATDNVDSLIDLMLRVRTEIASAPTDDKELRLKLVAYLDSLCDTLPQELRGAFGTGDRPARASLEQAVGDG